VTRRTPEFSLAMFLGRHPALKAVLRSLPGYPGLARLIHQRPQAVELGPGAGLRLAFGESTWIQALGMHEEQVQAALVTFASRGAVFFDVGANVGFYTVMLARLVGSRGHVTAFEPLPSNAAMIRRNADLNGLRNISVEETAVSATTGHIAFREETSGTGHIVSANAESTRNVACIALDTFVARGGPIPTLVKIDVEGHEVAVIMGMQEILRVHRPVIIAEMHGRYADFERAVAAFGYRLSVLNVDDPTPAWGAHILCVPAETARWPDRE